MSDCKPPYFCSDSCIIEHADGKLERVCLDKDELRDLLAVVVLVGSSPPLWGASEHHAELERMRLIFPSKVISAADPNKLVTIAKLTMLGHAVLTFWANDVFTFGTVRGASVFDPTGPMR